jgi:tetratricopeptide (TPR) repeat protein
VNAVSSVILFLLAQTGAQTADPEAKAKAQVLLKEGAQYYQEGAFADALERFEAAYGVFPSPKLLFNIGQANRELKRPVEAVEAFEKFLFLATDASPALTTEARRSVNELSPGIGKLFIDCNMVGAEISVDGKKVGQAPLADFVRVSPGNHQITATHPAATPAVETVTVAAGTVGTLSIRPRSLAEVAAAGQAPNSPSGPRADLHAARPSVAPPEDTGWYLGRRWTWVAAGSTVVFLGVAAIAGSSMQSKYDDLRKTCGKAAGANWTGCSLSDTSSLDTRKNIANVFWGLSAAAAVTTGVLFFVEGRAVTVAPMAGAATGFLANVSY